MNTNTPHQGYAAKRWINAVSAKLEKGIPRAQAILAVDREDPELRQKFLEEVNRDRANRYGLLRGRR